ncbi:MAG: Glu-tRNA(Gln) amidotransferase subunit GatD [Candidatus Bathyarchaeota archaeon]|nr:MAG: Glu-tRNA(Gln) amidotransferase subunit GatD [Candidatus Bathyarchaeota archaeon]
MGEDSLHDYRGGLRKALIDVGADIGDHMRVESRGRVYEGTLMPRLESEDDRHIVLKLRNGYNIGVYFDEGTRIERLGQAEKPEFRPPPLPETQEGLPRVSIISTGGTIASRVDYTTGGVHAAISSRDLLSIVPELSDHAIVDADILYSVFSENIESDHWSGMARKAEEKIQEGAQGVVITHGTDTMGYSSAALSFALRSLPVPVIFVGSQRSSDRPSSDAATNLVGVVTAAATAPFAEVVLGMHETTSDTSIVFHRGTKVRKCHTSARYAFQSVNSSPLARLVDGEIEMIAEDYRRRGEGALEVMDGFEEKVALLKFHPGLRPELIDVLVDDGYRGVILEGTGLGHVSEGLNESIRRAIEEDVILYMTSQCIWGRVDMDVYTTGRELQMIGVEPLGDMLPETAFVKLKWALGNSEDIDGARELMRRNIAGEYTDRTLYTGEFG